MKYWLVVIIYILFAGLFVNSSYSCSNSEKGIVTGGACSIQDLKKQEKEKQHQQKNNKKDNKKINKKTK